MLKDDTDIYGTDILDTPVCECDKGNETDEHYLLYCDMYNTATRKRMDLINDISVCSGHKGSFSISESSLLAPPCENKQKIQ